jgi:hypothetical protein
MSIYKDPSTPRSPKWYFHNGCPSKFLYSFSLRGPGSSVGIATDYGLDGPGIESRWGTGPGAHPACCTMGTGSLPEVKRPGRGADHPPPSSAEVENE